MYGDAMTQEQKTGERIAKVLARAGIASRRDAERLIAAGAVTVNGRVIDSPALDVTPKDRIAVEGRPLPAAEPPRLWLYYKPIGLVTTERDEKGRETVFENLPEELPRVLSVGRLDLNSEGLLLLTNDGDLLDYVNAPVGGGRAPEQPVRPLPPVDALEPGQVHRRVFLAELRDLLVFRELRLPRGLPAGGQRAGHGLPFGDRQARAGQPRRAAEGDHCRDHDEEDRKSVV